jgi:hypothetical protein
VYIFTIVENEIVVVEIVGDDKYICDTKMNLATSLSNVESIHLECDTNLAKNDQLTIIKTQVQKWKAHKKNSIGCDFFVVNNNLFIDFVNP